MLLGPSSPQIETTDAVASGSSDEGGRSSENDDGVSVSEWCAEKLEFFSEFEMTKVLEIGGDSFDEFLGEQQLEVHVATGEATRSCW